MKKLFKTFVVSIISLTVCVSSIMSQVSAFSPNSANNKSLSQKAKDFILNHKGKLGLGASALASVVVLFKILSTEKVDTEKVDIERYINNSTNLEVPADEWFKRLGGTSKDIEKYCKDKQKISSAPNELQEGFSQIDSDIPRTYFVDGSKEEEGYRIMLSNILKVWQMNYKGKYYTQGMSDCGKFIILKFCKNRANYAEAKAYYVFTKMMEMMYDNYITPALDVTSDSGKKVKDRITHDLSKKEKKDFYKLIDLFKNRINDIYSGFLVSPFSMCALRLCTYEESVKIWDQIILDDQITTKKGFNLDNFKKVMDAIIGIKIVNVYRNSGVISNENDENIQKLFNQYSGNNKT